MIGSRNNNVLALLAVAFVCISTVAGNSGGIRQGLGKARQLQAGGTPTFSPTTTFAPTAMATTASPTDTYAPTVVATTASPTNTYPPTAMATNPTASPTLTYAPTALGTNPTASPTLTYAPTALGTTQAPTDTYAPTSGGSSGASSVVIVDNSPLQTFTADDTYPAAVQALMTSEGCPSTGGEVSSGMSCKGDIPEPFQYLNCMYTTKKCLCRNDAPLYLCTRPQ